MFWPVYPNVSLILHTRPRSLGRKEERRAGSILLFSQRRGEDQSRREQQGQYIFFRLSQTSRLRLDGVAAGLRRVRVAHGRGGRRISVRGKRQRLWTRRVWLDGVVRRCGRRARFARLRQRLARLRRGRGCLFVSQGILSSLRFVGHI